MSSSTRGTTRARTLAVVAFTFGVLACSVRAGDETTPKLAADEPRSGSIADEATSKPNSLDASCAPQRTGFASKPSGWFDLDFTGQEWANGSRYLHSAVWDGREMIVFGGSVEGAPEAAAFDPESGKWSHVPTSGLAPRVRHVGVWTGNAMLIFGGESPDALSGNETTATPFDDGATFNPCSATWTPIARAPFTWRRGSSAVWSSTTNELIVYAGLAPADGRPTNDGWAYAPSSRRWRKIADSRLPPTSRQSAVWAGSSMIVFGGFRDDGTAPGIAAAYDPLADRWTSFDAPAWAPRGEDGVATGTALGNATFWGGRTSKTIVDGTGRGYFATNGATFDPSTANWTAIPAPPPDVLSERTNAMVWWANDRLFVFGGHVDRDVYDPVSHTAQDGAFFDVAARKWTRIERPLAYVMREGASVVWTGRETILIGGAASCTMCNPLPRGGVIVRP